MIHTRSLDRSFFKICHKLEKLYINMYFYDHPMLNLVLQIITKVIFSSLSYYVWETLVIVQTFDFRFLADLHVFGSKESKKHKVSMMSGCR